MKKGTDDSIKWRHQQKYYELLIPLFVSVCCVELIDKCLSLDMLR